MSGRKFLIGATASLFISLAMAQLPPPGTLQQNAPPPQPGQLGPAPDTLTPNEPTPNRKQQKVESEATIPGAQGDTDGAVFRGQVRYVLVPTSVVDKKNRGYVNGLHKEDFEVFDNDKRQAVDADYVEQPVSVVLVVQANSEIEPMLPTLRQAGVLMQGLVTGEQGDAAVLAFDNRMQVLQDFTNNPGQIDDAMHKLTSGSSTAALIDAVLKADNMLKAHDRQNTRRRVVVLLTRNQDKGSETKLEEAVHMMQFDNVIVYAVDMSRLKTTLLSKPPYPGRQNGGVPPEALPNITGRTMTDTDVISQENGNWLKVIPMLAHNVHDAFNRTPAEAFAYFSGGYVYGFSNLKGLEAAITDIGKDLNSQYILSYSPSPETVKEPGFHHIRVVVDQPGLEIRTRPGYWWGGGQQ